MKAKTLIKIILSLLLTMTLQAQESVKPTQQISENTTNYAIYMRMTTEELQEAVEALSLNGEYSLEMGMELFKRWSQES